MLQTTPHANDHPAMINTRIVCAHDAVKTAETLMRLLTAEGHNVRIAYGRASLDQLEEAKEARDAVLLIWSAHAPTTQYMDAWAHEIAPERMVEIALAEGWPKLTRRAPVIDFSHWRGERGARSWISLNDRLRAVARAMAPPQPGPKRAALAIGLVSAAAVAGALAVRVNDALEPPTFDDGEEELFALDYEAEAGMGGALRAIEPASHVEEERLAAGPFRLRSRPAPPLEHGPVSAALRYEAPALRDATFLERLTALAIAPRDD